MSQLSALMPFGVILFIFLLLANTGWLGMTVLNLALDTSRDSRRESARGTKAKIAASAVAEVAMVLIAAAMMNHFWSTLSV